MPNASSEFTSSTTINASTEASVSCPQNGVFNLDGTPSVHPFHDKLLYTSSDQVSPASSEPASHGTEMPQMKNDSHAVACSCHDSGEDIESTASIAVPDLITSSKAMPTELPAEIWEIIISQLDLKTHLSVSLVSKKFHRIVGLQYTWKYSFLRHFPGQQMDQITGNDWKRTSSKSDVRFFARLSAKGLWREELLRRLTLLESLSRGRPEADYYACMPTRLSGARKYATINYVPRLGDSISHLDATFPDDPNKVPTAIHGSATTGETSFAIPLTGKITRPPIATLTFPDFHAPFANSPHFQPYGLGMGPIFVPNVMDVSQRYGSLSFSSYPGGSGAYLMSSQIVWLLRTQPEVLHPPLQSIQLARSQDCVTSAWIAKSATIPSITQNRIGILTGSAMGFVCAFGFPRIRRESWSRSREPEPEWMRENVVWPVSPGVPIVSLKVDEQYSHKRMMAGRSWAIALNALGEVFTLNVFPDSKLMTAERCWEAGSSVSWHLVQNTKRLRNPDAPREQDFPSSSSEFYPRLTFTLGSIAWDASKAALHDIHMLCTLAPHVIRSRFGGWDMRRRLEVDFAGGWSHEHMEHIFVITCGYDISEARHLPTIRRYTRCVVSRAVSDHEQSCDSLLNAPTDVWLDDTFLLGRASHDIITVSSIDASQPALTTFEEEGLDTKPSLLKVLPGSHGRWLAVGTNSGAVVVWNARAFACGSTPTVEPICHIQTESPEVTSIAVGALCVMHGGSDGRLQAWDPLCSSEDPIRTINGKNAAPIVGGANGTAATRNDLNDGAITAIFLDPNPVKLRGLAACGRRVRCWSYNAAYNLTSAKHRHRFVDSYGRLTSKRAANSLTGHIHALKAEHSRAMQEESDQAEHLRRRFLLGDLTEDEAFQYAQVLSEETAYTDRLRQGSLDSSSSVSVSDLFCNLQDTTMPAATGTSLDTQTLEHSPESYDNDADADLKLAIMLSLQDVENQRQQDEESLCLPERRVSVPSASASTYSMTDVSESEQLRLALELSMQDAKPAGFMLDNEQFPAVGSSSSRNGSGKTQRNKTSTWV